MEKQYYVILRKCRGQRISVLEALGELGVIATTDDANTQNGEKLIPFYDDYLSGKPGMVTIYKIYDDGLIGTLTFLYRDDEIQSYYVGVKPGADGQPCISGKSVQEIAAINYTQKGYFIYEYKNPIRNFLNQKRNKSNSRLLVRTA